MKIDVKPFHAELLQVVISDHPSVKRGVPRKVGYCSRIPDVQDNNFSFITEAVDGDTALSAADQDAVKKAVKDFLAQKQ